MLLYKIHQRTKAAIRPKQNRASCCRVRKVWIWGVVGTCSAHQDGTGWRRVCEMGHRGTWKQPMLAVSLPLHQVSSGLQARKRPRSFSAAYIQKHWRCKGLVVPSGTSSDCIVVASCLPSKEEAAWVTVLQKQVWRAVLLAASWGWLGCRAALPFGGLGEAPDFSKSYIRL